MIWCLPGFLGRAADWEALRRALAAAGRPEVLAQDLFTPGAPFAPRAESLARWGERFAAHVAARDDAPIVAGYSLGGRLALHALLAPGARWRGAVIVSAHPGLDMADERDRRRADDERWARRFEHDPWEPLLTDWNARDVFGAQPARLDRPEAAYHRGALTAALRHWSLGIQESLLPRLASVTCPVCWIAGERDTRYVALGRAAARTIPRSELRVAPGVGHRVPWAATEWFGATVSRWLGTVR